MAPVVLGLGGSFPLTPGASNTRVLAAGDDGFHYQNYTSSNMNSNSGSAGSHPENIYIGHKSRAYYRIPVNVPKGATITSATLRLFSRSTRGAGCEPVIRAYAVDNVSSTPDYTMLNTAYSNLTSAGVPWDVGPTTVDTPFESVDFSPVVQEIVDRAGWVSGNNILLILMEGGTQELNLGTYEWNSGDAAAYLDIEYLAPSPPPPVPGEGLLGVGSTSNSLSEYPPTGPVTVGDWYVDANNGSDGNGGTSLESAFATVQAAYSAASPGDTIIVRGGTYSWSSALNITKANLKIYNYGTERPRYDRGNGGTTSGEAHSGIRVQANGVHIKGFSLTGVPQRSDAPDASYAIHIKSADDVIIEDAFVYGGDTGSVLGGGSDDGLIMDVYTFGSTGAGSGTNRPDGIVFTQQSSIGSNRPRIVRCFSSNAGDDCFDLWRAIDAEIIDSVAVGAGYRSSDGASLGDGNGFKMGGYGSDGSFVSGPNDLLGSIAVGNRTFGLAHNGTKSPGNRYLWNTVVSNGRGINSDTQGTPLETRNNIIVGNGSRNGETEVAGPFTNNYYNQPIGSVLFASTGAGDYSLLEGSPALTVAQGGGVAGASSVALSILKKMYNHSLVWIPGRGNGPGGTGLPGDTP